MPTEGLLTPHGLTQCEHSLNLNTASQSCTGKQMWQIHLHWLPLCRSQIWHVRDVSCASFVCLRTLYHSCSSWSENSVFSRRSCSISGRSLLFCFPMSAGRDGTQAPVSFHSNNWQCRGPFFSLVFFLSTPVSPRQEELMSVTIKQTGGWPPCDKWEGREKKTFSQQQTRAHRRSLCRRSEWPAR